MKKTFVTLLLAAIGIWGYVVAQVVLALLGGDSARGPEASGAPMAAWLARPKIALDTAFRDPFQSYLYAQKPVPVAPKGATAHAPPKVVDPPRAILTGILWGDAPVAILKQDGQTELVKEGAVIWDLKVLKIEKNQVVVQKQGRKYTLAY